MGHSRKKHKIYENLEIIGLSSEGLGIGRVNNKVVFVDNTLPGDLVSVKTYQRRKAFEKAHVTQFISTSKNRVAPFCKHFKDCGGCKLQHIPYKQQIAFKQQVVSDAFKRLAKIETPKPLNIIASKNTTYYRNKLEFTFSNTRWFSSDEISTGEKLSPKAIGFHVPGSYLKVVDIETCYLQNNLSNNIRNTIRNYALKEQIDFYNIKSHHGLLRNLIIRSSSLGETMVVLIINFEDDSIPPLMNYIWERFPQLTSLQYAVNPKTNDTYYDLNVILYKGKDYIKESIGNKTFKIRAKSFFQTNTIQANALYEVIKKFADLNKDDIVYDLYAGVGSIGIYLADFCKKVIGIEQIEQAVEDAIDNANENSLKNTFYFVGDVRMLFNKAFIKKNGVPSVLITDPPRAGMHPDVIETIIKKSIPKIIYVSCNPATQARDIALLSNFYKLEKHQAVDMFPQTVHIENVALLTRK